MAVLNGVSDLTLSWTYPTLLTQNCLENLSRGLVALVFPQPYRYKTFLGLTEPRCCSKHVPILMSGVSPLASGCSLLYSAEFSMLHAHCSLHPITQPLCFFYFPVIVFCHLCLYLFCLLQHCFLPSSSV